MQMIITGEQVRGAMGILRISRPVVSEGSNVPLRTVQRIAETDGYPSSNSGNVVKVAAYLAERLAVKGYEFTPTGGIDKIKDDKH